MSEQEVVDCASEVGNLLISNNTAEAKTESLTSADAVPTPKNKELADVETAADDLEDLPANIPPSEVIEEDSREHLNIVFIGHVDAGKSTIAGQVLYLTGQVDERTIEKYTRIAKENNRSTWLFAFIMDTNEEERARGKTVEVGRAYFESEKKRYTILDAPGHKNYVPNMIGGAAQADVAILVISAKKGEFESGFDGAGQTREHITLCKTLGVRQLIIAVNKMDETSVNWSQERFEEIKTKMLPFFKQTGYQPGDLNWIPLSGFCGINMKEKVDPAVCPWYTGPTLFQMLDDLKPVDRQPDGPLRIPCLDRFRDRGVVTLCGKVECGTISKGQKVILFPSRQETTISYVELDNEKEVLKAGPGENVSIGLSDIKETDIRPGYVLCDAEKEPVKVVTEFEAQIAIIELLPHKPVMSAGYEAVIHIHTCVEEVEVTQLVAIFNKKTRKMSTRAPPFVKTGSILLAKIKTAQPICVELFSNLQQLGRFTLRDEGKTIAIGKITKLYD